MTPLLLALSLQAAALPAAAPQTQVAATVNPRLGECLELAASDPVTAVVRANEWIAGNGGIPALQCLGLAEAGSERWDRAEAAFVKAAMLAEEQSSADEGNLWMQAGNAALAGGEGATALTHLDRAVATGQLSGKALGEVELDRARALVAAGRSEDAAAALAQATELVPQDPLAWLLSATLARRMDDLDKAASAIATAEALAPEEPSVLLERGNIAALSGDMTTARTKWQQVAGAAPNSPQGRAAIAQLATLAASGEAGGTDAPVTPPAGS